MKTMLRALACAAAMGAGANAAHAANLLTNGDFSQGAVGFDSGYTYAAPTSGSALYPEGVYTVASNPHAVHPFWVDLTDGTKREIVNGAVASTPVVWEEDGVATMAGQTYTFSGQAANVCCNATFSGENDPSKLLFQVSTDGGITFKTLATLLTHPPYDAGEFQTATFDFTALGKSDFRITDELNGQSGNDFAIQDLSVTSAAPEPSTWALMIAGLAMIGLAFRRARTHHGFRLADAFTA